MKFKSIVLSLAVVAMLFASCDDSKKKEAEETAKQEQMKMEQEAAEKMKMEEEAAMKKAEFEKNTIAAIAMGNENFSTLQI
jgi:PBP1b-binding outer membrane lipoprotein LpoB